MALNNAQTKTNGLAFRLMLKKHQLTEPNFNKWFRTLKLFVSTEMLQDVFEIALPPAPAAGADAQALADWTVLFYRHNEVAYLMLGTIKQTEEQSVSDHVLLMKSYLDQMDTLNYDFPDKVSISFILNSLSSEFQAFVQNYNMQSMEKTISEVHSLLIEFEKSIKRNKQPIVGASFTPQVMAIQGEIDPDRLCFNVEVEEHSLGDLNEPANYKTALSDPEFEKWLVAMNVEMQSIVQEVKTYLGKCFSMKDLGEATFILGIKIYRDRSRWLIGLSQNAYLDKILKGYRMDNSKRGSISMQVDLHLMLPPNEKVVKSKWIYKKNTDMDGKVHIYKARLVAKGCTQTYGFNYEETFSHVADIRAIRILITIAAYYDYEI
nr:zinc finger, CCHC-type [Tanacetum cinerariifolium]